MYWYRKLNIGNREWVYRKKKEFGVLKLRLSLAASWVDIWFIAETVGGKDAQLVWTQLRERNASLWDTVTHGYPLIWKPGNTKKNYLTA